MKYSPSTIPVMLTPNICAYENQFHICTDGKSIAVRDTFEEAEFDCSSLIRAYHMGRVFSQLYGNPS